MSIAFILEEDDARIGMIYVSDGILGICMDLEKRGCLPADGGSLRFVETGSQVVTILDTAIASLSDDGFDPEDHFAATESNAKACLSWLRDQIVRHPRAKVISWR